MTLQGVVLALSVFYEGPWKWPAECKWPDLGTISLCAHCPGPLHKKASVCAFQAKAAGVISITLKVLFQQCSSCANVLHLLIWSCWTWCSVSGHWWVTVSTLTDIDRMGVWHEHFVVLSAGVAWSMWLVDAVRFPAVCIKMTISLPLRSLSKQDQSCQAWSCRCSLLRATRATLGLQLGRFDSHSNWTGSTALMQLALACPSISLFCDSNLSFKHIVNSLSQMVSPSLCLVSVQMQCSPRLWLRYMLFDSMCLASAQLCVNTVPFALLQIAITLQTAYWSSCSKQDTRYTRIPSNCT